jgi:hypothetical protein
MTARNKIIGFDTTDPESIKEAQEVLKNVVLPWQTNDNIPPDYIRVTGMGQLVATVSARLGGYADCHNPEKHGWGYQAWPRINGSGSSISGIDMLLTNAQAEIDAFLAMEFPQLRVLAPVEQEEA